ncbi:unnamed protein product [Rotaria sp. Silwood2]|nr:unnamed protein product [Rotaria sp. Silwood2]CAF2932118.1 unnamed protein product [Rotaria sp. Silwood2]CAF3337023.1 unnamed protein product [Rotaria sp. Silwood2]CAF4174885.1 unnamed protein product [Rotaria sp. Silwood2]CAF4400916.1 unnamed protein product [Rotaria sp. Silwood2]
MQSLSQTVNETNSRRFVQALLSSNRNASSRWKVLSSIQNFILVWLNSNIDEFNDDFRNSITKLRRIVNRIDRFTDVNQCADFLTKIEKEKIFIIVSGSLGQSAVPDIHDMPQVDSIYVFCEDRSKHSQWAENWTKVKGVFTEIDSIYDVLKRDTQQCDRDSTTISVTSGDLNRLDPSFMYTQLLKDILIDMVHDEEERKELADFCRQNYHDNPTELKIIDEFEKDYHEHTPLWWYTLECFTYKMLNRALRMQEVQNILKMGFFLRDVHRNIVELHSQTKHDSPFTVYRGQNLSHNDFSKIQKNNGGLLAFNNFLSTSLNEDVSLGFIRNSPYNPEMVKILFKMTINPSTSSAPFASLKQVSAFENEEEILFSMHTVFRIHEIKKLEDSAWQVDLVLTTDNDEELKQLTEHIRKETQKLTPWNRLGQILFRMGNFSEAEGLYQILCERTSNGDKIELSEYYYWLGRIKNAQGDYTKALDFCEKSLEIRANSVPPNHLALAATYSSIATVYNNMQEYSKALKLSQKSLEIRQTFLPPNHPDLAGSYNAIASVHENMGEYSKALELYQTSLEIRQKSLPPNHPDLAAYYNNIASVYQNMGEYEKAFELSQKSREIQQKSLPSNHPDPSTFSFTR